MVRVCAEGENNGSVRVKTRAVGHTGTGARCLGDPAKNLLYGSNSGLGCGVTIAHEGEEDGRWIWYEVE